jgi:hypothetical protein
MNIIRRLLKWRNLGPHVRTVLALADKVDEAKILSAKILTNQIGSRGVLPDIKEAEFKVFSQFGEDGILQYLIHQTGLPPELNTFVEFGVENYTEANTRLLLINNNWRGLIIDGSSSNIEYCKSSSIYWKHEITAITAFIDADNINQLVSQGGLTGDIGILSIDIDGNDYWVWERLNVVNPIIVVCEYNAVFGAGNAITVPYDPHFVRGNAHYSHLYFGCSLKALQILGKKKGYSLVGTTSVGNNAFFVRNDYLHNLKGLGAEEAYTASRFRESRDKNGNLTYLSGHSRLEEIRELPVYDIERGIQVQIKDLPEP